MTDCSITVDSMTQILSSRNRLKAYGIVSVVFRVCHGVVALDLGLACLGEDVDSPHCYPWIDGPKETDEKVSG